MRHEALLTTLKPLCAGVDKTLLRDFVSRMDPDYFSRFQPADIARHVVLVGRLAPDHRCEVEISERPGGTYDLVIVAYDYFSEFATICGLLSAFGLDIREGSIYTYAEAKPAAPRSSSSPLRASLPWARRVSTPRRPGVGRKRIVDSFVVRPMSGATWSRPDQQAFSDELGAAIDLLDHHKFSEARHRVNLRLVERLARERKTYSGLLYPVDIHFDNDESPHDTVIHIRSTDTPAFLYAFSNALSMRGVYISKAQLEHVGTELRDRLYVRDRHGQKIDARAAQTELRVTAALIKQFTQFLTWAPDPAKAIEYFDQFLDRILEEAGDVTGATAIAFLRKKTTMALLARLLGSSDFLWEDFLRRQHANLLPLLDTYQRLPLIRPKIALSRALQGKLKRARTDEQRRRVLNSFKDQEMFRIDMKHLAEPDLPLENFSTALTELAEVVLSDTVRACSATLSRQYGTPRLNTGKPCPFTVLGMGKFGGRELGYASDIEVLFVYREPGRTSGRRPVENSEYFERLAQEILQWIEARQEGIFHLDVRLRPHGSKGQLTNTLSELRRYYGPSGLSAPFERQALIKLRPVTGDQALGAEVERLRDSIVYSGATWNLAEALELRQIQIKELVQPGSINVKYSPGGLIDIEYSVQYLQVMHGRQHPELRTPNTLEALAALGKVEIVSHEDCTALREAYLLLRLVIDGLRIVRGHAKDLVLPDPGSEAFIFLSRRVGYASEDWQAGAARLDADIRRHMARTSAFFQSHFQR